MLTTLAAASLSTLAATPATGGIALDLLKILACAATVALLFGRIKLAVIPGYLIAGAIIGPYALGLVSDTERIAEIASIATIMLMFGIGLHLDMSSLRSGMLSILLIGLVSTLLTAAACTAVAVAVGLSLPVAIAIGAALSMSSTAVVMKLLQQRRELYTVHGRLAFGIPLVQDILVIAALAAVPILKSWLADTGSTLDAQSAVSVITSALLSFAGVAAMVLVGRLVLPRIMVEAARHGSAEILIVVAAAVALGAAMLTSLLGLSPELGAFIAGFLLSSTPFRYQISGQITPIRDLFMALFFTAVGLNLNLPAVAPIWWAVLCAAAAIIIIKSLSIFITGWAIGASAAVSTRTALTLAQGGEFSLIVLGAAAAAELIGGRDLAVIVAAIVVTLIVTPALISIAPKLGTAMLPLRLAPWVRSRVLCDRPTLESIDTNAPADPDAAEPRAHVIIAGFGPVGRACAEKFEQSNQDYSIIELNPRTVRTQLALGRAAVFGDATNLDVLEIAGIDSASAIILTMPDQEAMLRGVRVIRSLRPDIFIATRANVVSRGMAATRLGADMVIIEEIAAAQRMAVDVLAELVRRADIEQSNAETAAAAINDTDLPLA